MGNYKGIRSSGMRWALPALLASVVAISPAYAQGDANAPVLNPDVPLEYTVKKGDTLWAISAYFLRDAWLWPELWNANPQVANPHLIYPGEKLYLVWVDGKPRLQREPPEPAQALNVVRLRPQARITPLSSAIPTIPLDAILSFLQGPRVIDKDSYEAAPHIVAFGDERLLGSSEADAYVRGVEEANGYKYSVVRKGQAYTDPDSGRLLGYEAIPVAHADVREFGDIAHSFLYDSLREVRKLDRLMPLSYNEFHADFYPQAPEATVDGRIIAVYDGVSQIGQYQIVTLNRGSDHGLQAGHILRVMQAGIKVKDPKSMALAPKVRLPDVNAGHLMVFKTFGELSYGLIMRATRPIHVQDKVSNPVAGV